MLTGAIDILKALKVTKICVEIVGAALGVAVTAYEKRDKLAEMFTKKERA